MRRIGLAVGLALSLTMTPLCAQTQPVHRIGYLDGAPLRTNTARIEAFRQGLRELGYVEGKNIVIEWREGNNDQVPALAAELVRLTVDVIISGALSLTRAAKVATSTIPIVMAQDPYPAGNGFVASLAYLAKTLRDRPRSPPSSTEKSWRF